LWHPTVKEFGKAISFSQPRETSLQDSNCVFRANLGQKLVEPVLFLRNFFASLCLAGQNHERTIRKGAVSNAEFILTEAIFWMLKQIHVAVNSVVVGGSRMTRMTTTDLWVAITNDHDSQKCKHVFFLCSQEHPGFPVQRQLGTRFRQQFQPLLEIQFSS